ncbi:aldose 1-epimerase family protein [Brumimicrobium oceani]|nr:aldose 1-epimerase family protein [Brumimicrobium oceani]
MLHTIENDFLICKIESKGAEIRSLENKQTGEEFIWSIDESIWGSSSPVLFPSIGNIKGNKHVFEGKEFPMTKHGIIRNNEHLEFNQIDPKTCTFTLKYSKETLRLYPFKFSFTVEFSLKKKRLEMKYILENQDSKELFFSCGGHTAYACPLGENLQLSDYVVEFPQENHLQSKKLGETGLLSTAEKEISIQKGVLALSETLFNEDALIFSNIEFDFVRLRKKNAKKGIIVRFPNYPNLALWSKPGADFLCIEPWLGLPDSENEALDISQKSTYKSLAIGDKFEISILTEIE